VEEKPKTERGYLFIPRYDAANPRVMITIRIRSDPNTSYLRREPRGVTKDRYAQMHLQRRNLIYNLQTSDYHLIHHAYNQKEPPMKGKPKPQ
jgi:hypothetical protein